jgi:dTDP-4-amino-4,6-dideoxygalactose transaminase
MIPFSRPFIPASAFEYVKLALSHGKLSGDRDFTIKCHEWLRTYSGVDQVLLTTSCTHALEMSALLLDIQPGDEVIMPSFTFSSTANAFALRGAKIAFVDIEPSTMNIDAKLIEAAITVRTRAIVVVHYAGVACDMEKIMELARFHKIAVIEDAAQGLMSRYHGRPLGSIGDFGCYSFHETKNYTSGEGGAILIQDERYRVRSETIREKGTNRSQFFRGEVDKYTWLDVGSSFLPSDMNAALLFSQLELSTEINSKRLKIWERYSQLLRSLVQRERIALTEIPPECSHNGHIFFIKVRNLEVRTSLISFLRENGVCATFHYVPLHSSPAGLKNGFFVGEDKFTTVESERLLRLPLFYEMTDEQLVFISDLLFKFFDDKM